MENIKLDNKAKFLPTKINKNLKLNKVYIYFDSCLSLNIKI